MTNEEAIEILENIPFKEEALTKICAVNMAIDALKRDTEPMKVGDVITYIPNFTSIRIRNSQSEIILDEIDIKYLHPKWYRFPVWCIKPTVTIDYYACLDIYVLTVEVE